MRIHIFVVMALTIAFGITAYAQTAKEITLYDFTGGDDGYNIFGGVVFDAEGNLYGTAFFGGTDDCGAVFQLTPKGGGGWKEETIHSFACTSSDPGHSYAHVTVDSKGDLFGTEGGGSDGGVFKLSRADGWKESQVFLFNNNTGIDPQAGLTAYKGSLYGSTLAGPENGQSVGDGTVFSLTPQANGQWKQNAIHTFSGGLDGSEPQSDLVFDNDGNAYGSTPYGGSNESGDIFQLTPSNSGKWTEKIIYSFPFYSLGVSFFPSTLIVDRAGNLYGTTSAGGKNGTGCFGFGCGTVFELKRTAKGWREITLYEFADTNDGISPFAGLVFNSHGDLYGTTALGGTGTCQFFQYSGCGTVFKLSRAGGGWKKTTVYNFTGGDDGEFPGYGSLVPDSSGNLYGTTLGGSTYESTGFGTVYEIQP